MQAAAGSSHAALPRSAGATGACEGMVRREVEYFEVGDPFECCVQHDVEQHDGCEHFGSDLHE